MTTDVSSEVNKLVELITSELAITRHVVSVSMVLDAQAKQEILTAAGKTAVKAFAALDHIRAKEAAHMLPAAAMAADETVRRWNELQNSLMTTWGSA